jgi:hypothetical protein
VHFSIRPLDLAPLSPPAGPLLPTFDGGEIFTYTPGSATSFLNHGGHLWDTAFDVRGTFSLNHENIDALEAVAAIPEPSTMALMLMALLVMPAIARRRRLRNDRS